MSERTEQYINRASATVLAIIALIKGVVAGFCLYHMFNITVLFIKGASAATVDINSFLDSLCAEFNMPRPNIDSISFALSLSVILIIVILAVIMTALLLVVIEAIALLLLRFARTGASAVKAIHIIYLVMSVINLLIFAYITVSYIISYLNTIKNDPSSAPPIYANIILILIAAAYLVAILLRLCFHKDIVRAMSTVKYDLAMGKPGRLKKTHLSGISFLFGLPYAIMIFLMILLYLLNYINTGNFSVVSFIVVVFSLAVIMLWYFSICLCNKNLKMSRTSRGGSGYYYG